MAKGSSLTMSCSTAMAERALCEREHASTVVLSGTTHA